MLVFRRRQGESFTLDDKVEVRILEIGRKHVKVGVIAPRQVKVLRAEVSKLNREAVLSNWGASGIEGRLRQLAQRLRTRKSGEPDTK